MDDLFDQILTAILARSSLIRAALLIYTVTRSSLQF